MEKTELDIALKSFGEEIAGNIEKKGFLTKEELSEVATELKEFKQKAEQEKDQLNEVISELKRNGIHGTETKSLDVEIKEQISDIQLIAKGASSKEIVLKAASNRASITNNQQAVDIMGIGQIPTRKLSLYDIFTKIQVKESNNNGVIRYYDWDEATTVRAAWSRAEGIAFPESTAKFKKGSVNIEKIGDTIPVTEEFFEDEVMFANELDQFLATNVALIIDDQLCNGTGASNTLSGLYQNAIAFTAVASGIPDANYFDLIVKVAEDMITTGGAKYNPDTVIMRRSEINKMKLKKDVNRQYVIPPFVSQSGKEVDGMLVIESNVAPANTMIVCDKRFAKIYEKSGVELSKGLVNAQFVEDAYTLKARKRLAFLIRSADAGAFRKVASISASLVTLAT